MHDNEVKKPVLFYTLDVIISVGYRVKSKRGIQVRQKANRVLKEYLVYYYAINERLRHKQIGELRQLIDLLGRTIQNQLVLQSAERSRSSTRAYRNTAILESIRTKDSFSPFVESYPLNINDYALADRTVLSCRPRCRCRAWKTFHCLLRVFP